MMKFSEFHKKVRDILNIDLPATGPVINEGRLIAKDVKIGRTTFMDKVGLASEVEYKKACIREKKVMYHAHIGMGSWQATAEALKFLYRNSQELDFKVDRVGICLDRRMGLPAKFRDIVPAETGPMLTGPEEWNQVGSAAPIQPHMGDFMIGFPASTENTINALRAGVTTIGNLSQFFAHEVPMWHDHVHTTFETVRALSIMGALRDQGALIHSYLEDGYGALFSDCATIAGWAFLERYIVEELIGGKLSHCIGGLTVDPVKRAGWVFALHEIHCHDCVGSMFYGDTISFTHNFTSNRALVSEYLTWDIMAQLECPTGHAVLPLPVSEAFRVPSAEEIAESQELGRRVEDTARRLLPHMDFSLSYQFAHKMVAEGRKVFGNALDGFKEAGVDVSDPLKFLYLLKQLGPAVFEEMFGAGEVNSSYLRGRKPVFMTDIFEDSTACFNSHRQMISEHVKNRTLEGRRFLIASTDVHEHAILILNRILTEVGAKMTYLGAEKNPDKVVLEACRRKVDAILLSTHNGMALEYAKILKAELKKQKREMPVVMGGVLNQKFEDRPLPIDVSQDLKELGFYPYKALDGKLTHFLEFKEEE
jgi:methylmalonyl-CoA mutase cobalamin-binding subunit